MWRDRGSTERVLDHMALCSRPHRFVLVSANNSSVRFLCRQNYWKSKQKLRKCREKFPNVVRFRKRLQAGWKRGRIKGPRPRNRSGARFLKGTRSSSAGLPIRSSRSKDSRLPTRLPAKSKERRVVSQVAGAPRPAHVAMGAFHPNSISLTTPGISVPAASP